MKTCEMLIVKSAVQQKGTSTESQLFVSVLNDAILMMRTYTAEGDLLTFVIDILVESFVTKPTIVSMVMPSGYGQLVSVPSHKFAWRVVFPRE
jgi:hypothetical protein